MQADAIKPGQTVVVIDDLIATGALRFFSVRRRGGLNIGPLLYRRIYVDLVELLEYAYISRISDVLSYYDGAVHLCLWGML